MTTSPAGTHLAGSDYPGRILHGDFSTHLKKRLVELIGLLRSLDPVGTPVMPYISAWKTADNRDIWYEYAGRRFLDLLGCGGAELPRVFRRAVVDQRVYRVVDVQSAIRREEISADRLDEDREVLRAAHTSDRGIDAVYQVRLPDGGTVWLKDLATVEIHRQDRLCLSVGNLTPVTKEMRSEEERIERERLQVSLEVAGAVCHELNQPIQGISGYAETLLREMGPGSPGFRKVERIQSMADRMGRITRKLMKITRYETMDYLKGVRIVDIDRSSEDC
ncbi:MAG: histidine kinase dimerization/phospho-acceptor domain-containing protein [Desulfobacterales bacterium]